jgi:hypothetical protein
MNVSQNNVLSSISISKHDMISVGSVNVQINLPYVGRVESCLSTEFLKKITNCQALFKILTKYRME